MAAVMLQVTPSLFTSFSRNSLSSSAKTYEKKTVSKTFCIARDDDEMCFLPNFTYHNILKGDNKELLQKLDAECLLPPRGLSVCTFQVPVQGQI